MNQKFVRGTNTNKQKDMQALAKTFWLAARDDKTGEIAKHKSWRFSEAGFAMNVFNRKEEVIEETRGYYSWSDLLGRCFGEKNAKRAIKDGECVPKMVTLQDGRKVKRWEAIGVQGTLIVKLFNNLCKNLFFS